MNKCDGCYHEHLNGMYCGVEYIPNGIYQKVICMCGKDFITDCRTEEGITIGLIDSLISISRVLCKRDFNTPEIKEALKDLYQDEDLKFILDQCQLVLDNN